MASKTSANLSIARSLLASASFKTRCETMLQACLNVQGDVDVLSVSSVDGRNVACVQRGNLQPARIAALSATLMSVSESLAKEVAGGGVDHALLSLRQGVVVSRRLNDRTGIFTLSLIGRGSINLALALRTAIDVSDALVAEIESEIASASLSISAA